MSDDLSYVCISLARAQGRRSGMAEQFAEHKLNVRFFDAVEVSSPVDTVPDYDTEGRLLRYGRPLSRGEVGCYLSHRAVWSELVESSSEAWCILEDDITLLDGFEARTRALFAGRAHWDIVRLMGLAKRPQIEYATLPNDTKLMWVDDQPHGTQCYMITRKAAERMLKYTSKITHPIDIALDRHWEHQQRLYITAPEFVADQCVPTMIEDRAIIDHTDVRSVGQRMKAAYRRKVERLTKWHYNNMHRPTASNTIKIT